MEKGGLMYEASMAGRSFHTGLLAGLQVVRCQVQTKRADRNRDGFCFLADTCT